MRKGLLSAVIALALAACSGGGEAGGEGASGAEPVAASVYQTEIAPLLANACATCHLTGTEAGNLIMVPGRAIESLVNVASVENGDLMRVVPGKPDESYLIMKLEGTHIAAGGAGAIMPFGAPPLPAEEIAKVRRWIAEGAKP